MPVLYSDNVNRIQRVKDLANDIATYQDEIKTQNENQKAKDERAYNTLASIAKSKGFDTPEEYIQHAIDALPAEEQKKYNELRDQMKKAGHTADMVIFVSGAVATLGLATGLALTDKGLAVFKSIGNWCCGVRATAQVVALEVDGAAIGSESVEAFSNIARQSFHEFKGNLADVSFGAEAGADVGSMAAEGVEEVGALLKFGRIASRVLVPLAILATIGGLIYEGIEGHNQMVKCQDYLRYILDLASKRFMVRKLKDHVEASFGFMDEIYALLMFEDMVNQDEDIPKEKKAEKIAKKVKQTAEKFGKVKVPIDDTVVGSLKIKDENADSWTKEDPKLNQIQAHLEELKKKEKKD
ncbi:hypothetical protein V8F33_010682 [Rhypophila sp. PSN 637]